MANTAFGHDATLTTPGSTTDTALVRWANTSGTSLNNTINILSDGSNITLNARGEVRFSDADSSHYIAFESPATVGTSYTMTLPADLPAADEVLTVTSYSSGAGVLEWAAVSIAADSIVEAKLNVSNGPTNGQVLTARSGVAGGYTWEAAAGGGAITWEDGNTVEDSSTSTSVEDLSDVTGLSITGATPIRVWTAARYGAGGGDNASIGLTINGTAMRTPVNPAVASQGWEANGNDDMDGVWILDIGPRVTNYTKGLLGFANRHPASGVGAAGAMHGVNAQAAMPTGNITSIVHTGIVASGATIATDEMHVYSWAIS